MNVKYCLPIIKSQTAQVLKIISENQKSYDYFEIWLDYIQDLSLDLHKFHPSCHSEPCLAGRQGSEESNDNCEIEKKLIFLFRRQNLETPKMDSNKRIEIINLLSGSQNLLDLDIFSQKKELQYIRKNLKKINLILSYHNYQETPGNAKLKRIVSKMIKQKANIYKISTFCVSDADAVRLLDLLTDLKEKDRSCIILGMGQKGTITRIAGAILGNITFAPLFNKDQSASGQLTKDALEKILKNIQICYFIADPVEHSLSPQMHEAGYRTLGIDNQFVYLRHRVKPKGLKQFILDARRDPHFRGASISIPHKVAVMRNLDEIDEKAEEIGAVNTIVKNGQKLKGYNTDWLGIINPLKAVLPNLKNKVAAVIGAGGAARAAVFALVMEGVKVVIFNRNLKKAQKLAKDFNCEFDSLDNIDRIYNFDIVINATKVGLNTQDAPIIPKRLIQSNQVIFDVVYSKTSPETKLIKQARKQGAVTISGISMLLYQGIVQFELFTGKKAPLKEMRQALL